MEGVIDLYPEPITKGVVHISQYEFKHEENPLFNLRALRDGNGLMYMYDGKYVRLHINSELVMSDTHMELQSNAEFVIRANGHILIAGLGLGLIIKNILNKPDIKSITVIEIYQDVIDIVSDKFNDNRITYIHDNIFDWKPEKGIKYDTIYFDIWSEISIDNLYEIKTLHNKFKYYVNRNNPNHYMNSWLKEYLQNKKRQERQEYHYGF